MIHLEWYLTVPNPQAALLELAIPSPTNDHVNQGHVEVVVTCPRCSPNAVKFDLRVCLPISTVLAHRNYLNTVVPSPGRYGQTAKEVQIIELRRFVSTLGQNCLTDG